MHCSIRMKLYLEPNEGQIDKKAGKLISSFKDIVFPEDYVPGAKKRVRATWIKISREIYRLYNETFVTGLVFIDI